MRFLPRPGCTRVLAKRRSLKHNGREIDRTPLLIPSFSSKGFPDIDKIIKYSSELIDGVTLISAYDLHYGKIKPPFDFPSLIFLDSGGYEASKDTGLSDFGEREHMPKPWNQDMHEAQLADWQPSVPSVLISYDHPKERLPIKAQIERAKAMAGGREGFLREILLKPETAAPKRLQMDDIIKNVHALYQIPKNLTRPLDFPKVPGSDSEMSRRIRHGDAYFVTQRF